MPPRVVEPEGLLDPRLARLQLPEMQERHPEDPVADELQGRVSLAFREGEELLGQPAARLVLAADEVVGPAAVHDREELVGAPHLLAQLVRPRVGGAGLRGSVALRGDQRHAERALQRQLELVTLG